MDDGGGLPKEDGNRPREDSAMHEENFLSRWLRENVEGDKAEMERLSKEAEQEEKSEWDKGLGQKFLSDR